MSRLKALWRAQAGTALVEYALVLPVLLMLVFGVMQLGAMAWTQAAISYAVQEAARCAAVRPDLCGDAGSVQTYAAAQTLGLAIPAKDFQVTQTTCGWDVKATVDYRLDVPAFNAMGANLTAEVCHA
jgi:Flp pilus assembly protein TadG